jgi:hypothetical protein
MAQALTPRRILQENIRPAELLLQVYRLLEYDALQTEGDMINALRTVVRAAPDEDLILVYNEIFLGLVRESSRMSRADLKRAALDNLLRQAVVVACTGLDTYLPAVLRANLPTVIDARGRNFVPQDKELMEYFKSFTFSLSDTLRLLGDPGEEATLFIANKMLRFMHYQYLSSSKGVRVVGLLLGLDNPWEQIAAKLGRNSSADLETMIRRTSVRRNDIVHRADRSEEDPEGAPQTIGLAWAQQAVDTIKHVCLALDELVAEQASLLRAEIAGRMAAEV